MGPSPVQFEDIKNVKLRWNNVSGPISNMVACLYSIGWFPSSFFEWLFPSGDVWTFPTKSDNPVCLQHVVHAVQDSASVVFWQSASKHYLGKGLQDGISFVYSMRLLHHFRKEKIYDRAAALESIMVSACWLPQRKFDHNLISESENVWPHCSAFGCDELHQYWTCPKFGQHANSLILETQFLVDRAVTGVECAPCYWLRGPVPASMLSKPVYDEEL